LGHRVYVRGVRWELLTGFWGDTAGVIGAAADGGRGDPNSPCDRARDTYRTSCESILKSAIIPDYYWSADGQFIGGSGCYPRNMLGFSSMVNVGSHQHAGHVLAHELGHNLGFAHLDEDICRPKYSEVDVTMVARPDGQWSECSVDIFHTNWENNRYSCAEWSQDPKLICSGRYRSKIFLYSPNGGRDLFQSLRKRIHASRARKLHFRYRGLAWKRRRPHSDGLARAVRSE
jgi:hypothetical protein